MKYIIYLIIALLLTSFTQKDASELVKVLYGESGSNYRDAWYVCQVIKNRKTEWDYKNLRDVVSSRKQFNGYKTPPKNVKDSLDCIIYHVINDNIPDSLRIDKKTLYFCNPKIIKNKKVLNWFRKKKLVKVSHFSKNVAHYYYK